MGSRAAFRKSARRAARVSERACDRLPQHRNASDVEASGGRAWGAPASADGVERTWRPQSVRGARAGGALREPRWGRGACALGSRAADLGSARERAARCAPGERRRVRTERAGRVPIDTSVGSLGGRARPWFGQRRGPRRARQKARVASAPAALSAGPAAPAVRRCRPARPAPNGRRARRCAGAAAGPPGSSGPGRRRRTGGPCRG